MALVIVRWPCDTQLLRDLVDDALAEASLRGSEVDAEELAVKAVNALSQAVLEGHPLTDIELSAVLTTYAGNRSAEVEVGPAPSVRGKA